MTCIHRVSVILEEYKFLHKFQGKIVNCIRLEIAPQWILQQVFLLPHCEPQLHCHSTQKQFDLVGTSHSAQLIPENGYSDRTYIISFTFFEMIFFHRI